MKAFYILADTNKLTKTELFKRIGSTSKQINDLMRLINEHIYQHGCTRFFAEDSEAISAIIVQEFRQIVCLFYLKKNNSNQVRLNIIRSALEYSLNQPLESLLHERAI